EEGIKTVKDLHSVMDGVYNAMSSEGYYGRYIIVAGDVRSSNAFSTGRSGRFLDESKLLYPVSNIGFWDEAYETIANTNLIINSKDVPEGPEANYVKGQAYALRALAHMDLLITYGQAYVDGSDKGIPYITTY